jgi:hypothetical protein
VQASEHRLRRRISDRLGVFALVETEAKFPLLPPRVVLDRTRGGSLLVSLLGSVGVFGVFLFLTLSAGACPPRSRRGATRSS